MNVNLDLCWTVTRDMVARSWWGRCSQHGWYTCTDYDLISGRAPTKAVEASMAWCPGCKPVMAAFVPWVAAGENSERYY